MRWHIEVHHHHHPDPETLAALRHVQSSLDTGFRLVMEKLTAMSLQSAKLESVTNALLATVAAATTKLDSIEAYVRGNPDVTAAAVASALAAAGVEEDAAADLIEDARARAAAKVDEVLAAIPANTQPTDTGGAGGDTTPAEPPAG